MLVPGTFWIMYTTAAELTTAAVEKSTLLDTTYQEWWKSQPCSTVSCKDEKFPFLFFNEQTNECSCMVHPCFDDQGVRHTCPIEHPYLHFKFDEPGRPGDMSGLKCKCSKEPQLGTVSVERVCGGLECADPNFPVLALDEKGVCYCRQHPCHDDDGILHKCDPDGEHPLLRYSYTPDGDLICECYSAVFGGWGVYTHEEF